jgi:hypothetical protein
MPLRRFNFPPRPTSLRVIPASSGEPARQKIRAWSRNHFARGRRYPRVSDTRRNHMHEPTCGRQIRGCSFGRNAAREGRVVCVWTLQWVETRLAPNLAAVQVVVTSTPHLSSIRPSSPLGRAANPDLLAGPRRRGLRQPIPPGAVSRSFHRAGPAFLGAGCGVAKCPIGPSALISSSSSTVSPANTALISASTHPQMCRLILGGRPR